MPDDGARGDSPRGDGAIDFDRAWQELLASLTDGAAASAGEAPVEPIDRATPAPVEPVGPAPVDPTLAGSASEPVQDDRPDSDEPSDDEHFAADNEHFEPPPAPPLPTLRGVTVVALAAMVVGILILALQVDGGDLAWLGVLAIVGGAASLVYNMRSGPPTDSGWDDGAVL